MQKRKDSSSWLESLSLNGFVDTAQPLLAPPALLFRRLLRSFFLWFRFGFGFGLRLRFRLGFGDLLRRLFCGGFGGRRPRFRWGGPPPFFRGDHPLLFTPCLFCTE